MLYVCYVVFGLWVFFGFIYLWLMWWMWWCDVMVIMSVWWKNGWRNVWFVEMWNDVWESVVVWESEIDDEDGGEKNVGVVECVCGECDGCGCDDGEGWCVCEGCEFWGLRGGWGGVCVMGGEWIVGEVVWWDC